MDSRFSFQHQATWRVTKNTFSVVCGLWIKVERHKMFKLPQRLVKSPFVSFLISEWTSNQGGLDHRKAATPMGEQRVTHKTSKRERRLDKCSRQSQLKCNELSVGKNLKWLTHESARETSSISHDRRSASALIQSVLCANSLRNSWETTRKENYIMIGTQKIGEHKRRKRFWWLRRLVPLECTTKGWRWPLIDVAHMLFMWIGCRRLKAPCT